MCDCKTYQIVLDFSLLNDDDVLENYSHFSQGLGEAFGFSLIQSEQIMELTRNSSDRVFKIAEENDEESLKYYCKILLDKNIPFRLEKKEIIL